MPPPVCTNGNITLTQSDLIEGNFPSQGIVEICLFGRWKEICVSSVSDDVVMHLCDFLKFSIPGNYVNDIIVIAIGLQRYKSPQYCTTNIYFIYYMHGFNSNCNLVKCDIFKVSVKSCCLVSLLFFLYRSNQYVTGG